MRVDERVESEVQAKAVKLVKTATLKLLFLDRPAEPEVREPSSDHFPCDSLQRPAHSGPADSQAVGESGLV